ncbi:MAG: GuaB3 family IMP dehydrogenase-related protein [bacterium]
MEEVIIGGNRKARRVYGFDDVSIVPSEATIDPEDTETEIKIGEYTFTTPFMASAMDGVVDVKFAIEMGKLGGLAVLNLHGLQTRYDNPGEILDEIAKKDPVEATPFIQEAYRQPIKDELIGRRVEEIKKGGVICSVSSTPQDAERFGAIAAEAGVDIFVIQSTVTSTKHLSTKTKSLDVAAFCRDYKKPVLVGNSVSYKVAMNLMEAGVSGILVGVGPGAACTTRGVLGIGVPQITCTADSAAARDDYMKKTGRYVTIITDGGMRVGGDICKAFASGADAVMIGSPFARADEAPGRGYHWGMATSHAALPRGTRVRVGVHGPLKNILLGPSLVDDGSQNLLGSIKNAMGLCGARTIAEFQHVELVISPSFMTEGKLLQTAQRVGMGR